MHGSFASCEMRPEKFGCPESHLNIIRFPVFASLGSGPCLLVPGRATSATVTTSEGPRDEGISHPLLCEKVNSSHIDRNKTYWYICS